MWRGNEQIGDAFAKIEMLESMGKNVYFVTNNATKLPADAADKMRKMGYSGVKLDHVYTSGACVAKYVVRRYPEVKKVFAIGEVSVRDALEAEGITVVGANEHVHDPNDIINENEFDNLELDDDIKAVVYGLDMSYTHQKLCYASLYINERKCPLIVTNDDRGVKI